MKSRFSSLIRAASAVAAAAAGVGVAHPAHAQTACSSLGHTVIVTGSSAVKPFLAAVAAKLQTLSTPIFIVYPGVSGSTGSCDGVGAMSSAAATVSGVGAIYWDTNAAPVAGGCDLDLNGSVIDIGASDVFASTCGKTVTTDVKDFRGPIQSMNLAVPSGSTATSISAEAAYMVYGFGADTAAHQIAPWTDSSKIFMRSASSGTQNMIAKAINVPGAKWIASGTANSDEMRNALIAAATGDPNLAIGILSSDYLDKNRSTLKGLAFQATGQTCGYTPDSDGTKFDKQNVRDGHYDIWGPLHMYAHTGTDGKATNPDAQTVIEALSLSNIPAGLNIIQLEAKGGVVPDCAMRVTRDSEVGPMSSYMPTHSCECQFVAEATGTAPTDCTACTGDGDCTTAKRGGVDAHHCALFGITNGYCEVQ